MILNFSNQYTLMDDPYHKSKPSTSIVPLVGRIRPIKTSAKELFPEPDFPTIPTISPSINDHINIPKCIISIFFIFK